MYCEVSTVDMRPGTEHIVNVAFLDAGVLQVATVTELTVLHKDTETAPKTVELTLRENGTYYGKFDVDDTFVVGDIYCIYVRGTVGGYVISGIATARVTDESKLNYIYTKETENG